MNIPRAKGLVLLKSKMPKQEQALIRSFFISKDARIICNCSDMECFLQLIE